MSEEEYMECSVVAYPRQIKFLHINGGAISYYVDRHVSDYVDKLQKENQKYKEVIDKAIEFSNKNWGTWCSNHLEYMTELQNILKGVNKNNE